MDAEAKTKKLAELQAQISKLCEERDKLQSQPADAPTEAKPVVPPKLP